MKHLVIAAIGITGALGGAGLGRALSEERGELSAPAVGSAPSQDDGNSGLFDLEVEPSAVLANGSRRGLEYRVQLASRFAQQAHAALAIEVVDDRGHAVQQAARPGPLQLAPGAKERLGFVTPTELRDGYYQVRVTAAMAGGELDELKIAERYFRVEGGSPAPLTADEWFQQSAANSASPL